MRDKTDKRTLKAAVSLIRSQIVVLGKPSILLIVMVLWQWNLLWHVCVEYGKVMTSKTVKSLPMFRPRWRSKQCVSLIIWRSWVRASHGATPIFDNHIKIRVTALGCLLFTKYCSHTWIQNCIDSLYGKSILNICFCLCLSYADVSCFVYPVVVDSPSLITVYALPHVIDMATVYPM